MATLTRDESGPRPAPRAEPPPQPPVYTRYAAAPTPAHPVREPSFVHALLVAAWLGRVIDPLPHPGRRVRG